jgi:hypothetical protein
MVEVSQIDDEGSETLGFDRKLSVKQIEELIGTVFGKLVSKAGKEFVLAEKVGLLVANVTYLGIPHPVGKKRIQIKSYYPEYLRKNSEEGMKTAYVGVYSFPKKPLFVVFEPGTYAGKASNNSSAHVQIFDLQYGMKAGAYRKTDAFGNVLTVFDEAHFKEHVLSLAGIRPIAEEAEYRDRVMGYLSSFLASVPSGEWLGSDCYSKMAEAKSANALQGEWEGFFFEHLFKEYLREKPTDDVEWGSGKKESEVDLDLSFPKAKWFFGDLKTDNWKSDILGNDMKTMEKVLELNGGRIWYVVMKFSSEKDSLYGYAVTRFWDKLRGGKYTEQDYRDMKGHFGSRMKFSVKPKIFEILNIDATALSIMKTKGGIFAQGKNSDSKPRGPKIKIGPEMEEALTIFTMKP